MLQMKPSFQTLMQIAALVLCKILGIRSPNRVIHLISELVTYLGYASAVGVPLLSAFISLLTRQCKHVPPYILMLWFGTGGLIVSSICKILNIFSKFDLNVRFFSCSHFTTWASLRYVSDRMALHSPHHSIWNLWKFMLYICCQVIGIFFLLLCCNSVEWSK